MGQNQNQLSQTPVKGQLKAIPNPDTMSCQILPTSSNSFVAASPVKLISGTSQQLLVDLAAATDTIFGFIIFSPKKNTYVGGDRIEVALTGSVMEMEAGDTFNRGQNLEFQATGTKVIAWAGSNAHIGVALDQAPAAGTIVRVLIKTSLEDSSSSSSSSCRSSSSSCSSRSSSSSSCSSSSSSCRSSSSSSSSSAT